MTNGAGTPGHWHTKWIKYYTAYYVQNGEEILTWKAFKCEKDKEEKT